MIVAKNDSLIKIKLAEVASVYFCALIWIPRAAKVITTAMIASGRSA